jgi:hypothetical protein
MRKRELIPLVGSALAAAFLGRASLQTSQAQSEAPALAPVGQTSGPGKTNSPSRTSFYAVPLVCPAAPAIGCGSAAKPLLLELEASSGVSEAWLNRAGTLLAIVWSEGATSKQRSQTIRTCLKEKEIPAKALSGDAKRRAWKDFESGNGWYRGAAVDRLSEEEAGIIARRWVMRIRGRVTLTDPTAEALEKGFTGVVRQKLLCLITRSKAQEEMVDICRQHLNEEDVATLMKAFAEDLRGSRPIQ